MSVKLEIDFESSLPEKDVDRSQIKTEPCEFNESSTNSCPTAELSNSSEEISGIIQSQASLQHNTAAKEEVEKGLVDNDAYFYTKREEFTSELFKIEIKNMPRYAGFKELRKLANKVGAFPKKVKIGHGGSFAFMSFGSEKERQEAILNMNGVRFKGRELVVKPAKPKADPFILKRKIAESGSQTITEKKARNDEEDEASEASVDRTELMLNSVTPLWKVPYEEQLKLKEDKIRDILRNATVALMRCGSAPWIKKNRTEFGGICCCLHPIKPSPVTENYRNKVEFNIAKEENGEVVVGFRTGNYKGGRFGLVGPTKCLNVTQKAKEIAQAFKEYLKTSSYPPYDNMLHTGFWRQLTVRSCRSLQTMVIAQSHPQQLTELDIKDMKDSLHKLFLAEDSTVKVESLYLQLLGQRQSLDDTLHSYHHVGGTKAIEESMMDMKFRISPDAFFQVNTSATEVLYSIVKDMSLIEDNTTVLDICCGTGTIGLTLAKAGAKKVIGLELSHQAVEDARHNAASNGLKNVEFLQGKAEDTIHSALKDLPSDSNIVAVVDPPRAGLHTKVVQAIRRCSRISRLVYVSCNPKLAANNFVDLCRDPTRRNRGSPFQLQEAVPVDLFPHTPYCELVLLFTREGSASEIDDVESVAENISEIGETAGVKVEPIPNEDQN